MCTGTPIPCQYGSSGGGKSSRRRSSYLRSAYHASAIGVPHASELLEGLLRDVEVVHGLRRGELLAGGLLYVSHETFTCARSGDGPADLFTKVLDDETFKRHRATIMNLKAKP